MVFPPLGDSNHVVASVSIVFLLKGDSLFHQIAFYYSCADWHSLNDHLRDVPY